jgi:hypothetical protein
LEVWCVGGLGIVVTTVIPRIQIGRWRSPESISSTESQAGPGRLPAAIHSQSAVVRGRWRKKGTLGKSLSMPSRPDILPTLQQQTDLKREEERKKEINEEVFAVKRGWRRTEMMSWREIGFLTPGEGRASLPSPISTQSMFKCSIFTQ